MMCIYCEIDINEFRACWRALILDSESVFVSFVNIFAFALIFRDIY